MKNIIALLTLAVSTCAFGQVAIGKSAVTNTSVSLEFGDYVAGQGKGIIVPWVTSAGSVTGAQQGTIVFDTADKIMKYRKADGTWLNLTKNETTTIAGQAYDTTGSVNTTLQASLTERPVAKTAVGAPTATPGILVLEDANKAMVLPKVPSPHLNIVNPEPGMMVYDTATKQLAVFNGTVWSFWRP
ncbi:hypothetical protein [Chryseobacterium taklimakanense]|uniref:hypothetical protein n=1 Tax=Chryseobacterium taklimakanense TaxID=536441 RepID=UPI0023F89DA0|nr:hypothetical protein [Chryseobacterium taklimakanense]